MLNRKRTKKECLLGKRIRALRKRKGFTQKELASKCQISYETIRAYETSKRGLKRPDIGLLVKICKVLDVTTDYLILGIKN